MGQTEVGSKGRELLWTSLQHGERSDKMVTVVPDDIQYSSECSGQGGPPGFLWTPGGPAWVRMGSGRAQYMILHI